MWPAQAELVPNQALLCRFALPTADQVFLSGHRMNCRGPVERLPALRSESAEVVPSIF